MSDHPMPATSAEAGELVASSSEPFKKAVEEDNRKGDREDQRAILGPDQAQTFLPAVQQEARQPDPETAAAQRIAEQAIDQAVDGARETAVATSDALLAETGTERRLDEANRHLRQIAEVISREPAKKPIWRIKNVSFVAALIVLGLAMAEFWDLTRTSVKKRIDLSPRGPSPSTARRTRVTPEVDFGSPTSTAGLEQVFDAVAVQWAQMSEVELWTRLGNYVDRYGLLVGEQCVLLQSLKYWCRLKETYRCTATELADHVDSLVDVYVRSGQQIGALYRAVPPLRLGGAPLPRTVALTVVQRALALIWGGERKA